MVRVVYRVPKLIEKQNKQTGSRVHFLIGIKDIRSINPDPKLSRLARERMSKRKEQEAASTVATVVKAVMPKKKAVSKKAKRPVGRPPKAAGKAGRPKVAMTSGLIRRSSSTSSALGGVEGSTAGEVQELRRTGSTVRCLTVTPTGGMRGTGWKWQFVENDKTWRDYDPDASAIVEQHYSEWLSKPNIDVRAVKSGQWHYQVDFNEMIQQNIQHSSHTVRKIRRVSHTTPPGDKFTGK
eukprot:Sspe_Gene.2468::Locus_818_Transcript_1_1_Confidence_1.000_Length_826::g.2468::m.2468